MSLEELILRHAAGLDMPTYDREQAASGAMMLPIPRGGGCGGSSGGRRRWPSRWSRAWRSRSRSGSRWCRCRKATATSGSCSRGGDADEVEAALREAHRRLSFLIVAPGEQDDEAPCLIASPRSILLPLPRARGA